MMPRLHASTHWFAPARACAALSGAPDGRLASESPCLAGARRGWTPSFIAAALAIVVLLPATVTAQTGGYISFNGGTQATSTSFSDNIVYPEFHEVADFNAAYGVGTGVVYDASGGVRLPSGLGFGVGVSRFDKLDPVSIDARVPHPFFFNRPRSLNGSESDLARMETAVHLEIRWFERAGETVDLAVFGGPTFFDVKQDLATAIEYGHEYPYTEASFVSASTATRSASAIGFHAGADIGFFFSEVVGVGAIVRYSKATVELASENEGMVPVDAGGFHIGGGLRIRF